LLPLIFLISFSLHVNCQGNILDISIDKTTQSYTILVKGEEWFHSGDYAVHLNKRWYSTADKSLQFMYSSSNKGEDRLGKFDETVFVWSAGSVSWLTTFKSYLPQPIIIFNQIFQQGIQDTATGNNNDVISAFPTFKVEKDDLNYLTYYDTFSNGRTGTWGPGTSYPHGIRGGIPLALFNSNLVTVMISPFNNFLIGEQTLSQELHGLFACGLQGKIQSVPTGFVHSTIITASQGVNNAHMYWGGLLLKFYGKAPKTVAEDFSVKYLGYWTDNGAYYYYLSEPGKNYAETMVDVYDYIKSIDLPVQYYQYDSWWYFKGSTSGLLLWEPKPDVFPDGIKALQQKMGSKPIVLHNRWFENDTYYMTKMGYPFISESKGYAIPLSEEPFLYMMTKAKDWGLIVYEQDWLVDQYLDMEATQTNVSIAHNWMTYMNNAATKVGLTIQMCMPLPGHILQSVLMSSVTQVRGSGDYQRQIYDKNNWALGYTSMLHHALGLFPFKDCFWSSNATQTGCVQKVCVEPNAVLETLTAALSTGPVGPADKIGFLDKYNLMQTCRSDGVLLKPDIPLKTLDLVFSTGFKTGPRLFNLSHAYSQQIVKDEKGNTAVFWHYILAADTEMPFSITLDDLGEPTNAQFVVFDYFKNPTTLAKFNNANPLNIEALYPTGETVSFKYYVIVPLLGGYTLIGERDKYAVASFQRFGTITKTSNTTTVNIMGVSQEHVNIQMLYEPTQSVETHTCIIGASGVAVLSCDITKHECTCQ